MDYSFAKRVQQLKPSVIREILKLSSDPNVIPFSAGNPAPEAFPSEQVAEITNDIFGNNPIGALQYSVTEGYTPLRNLLKDYMKNKYNSFKDSDELIITSGAQQVAELTTKALCNEGDTVICESPSFVGVLNAIRSFGVNLCGIPLDQDGMNLEKLERALKEEKNVKFIYIIPNFQNPSGITTSWEKRKAIYELAKKYGVMILEDNPYGELRVSGEHIPTIKSIDEDEIVIYAGSFSKVLSPGLRVGWCVAPKTVCSKIIVCKQVSDVHTTILSQLIADKFMRDYDFDSHIAKIREIYKIKMGIMLDALKKDMPSSVTWNIPEGGLFIWCDLPKHADMLGYCKETVQRGVAVVPGNAFLTDENIPCTSIRLNFSTPTNEQIVKGVEILGKTAKELF